MRLLSSTFCSLTKRLTKQKRSSHEKSNCLTIKATKRSLYPHKQSSSQKYSRKGLYLVSVNKAYRHQRSPVLTISRDPLGKALRCLHPVSSELQDSSLRKQLASKQIFPMKVFIQLTPRKKNKKKTKNKCLVSEG